MKWLKYILALVTLSVVTLQVAAQENYVIDSVCVGAERYYRVDGEVGSTYSWLLTDTTGTEIPLTDPGTTLNTTDTDGNPITTSEIRITWNELGIFTLSSIQVSGFGCDTVEQGDIKVFDHPDIYAGNDQNVCPGSSVSLNEAYGSNYSTVYWTTSGDGTFDDPTLLHPVYTPGTNDLLSDVITVTITAQGIGNGATCTPAVDSLDLNIIHLAASLDSTPISCYGSADGSIIVSGATGGLGKYNFEIDSAGWSSGWTTATTFDNLGPGIYTLQMRDSIDLNCVAIVGNIEVLEPDPLTAQVDSADATCLGNDGTIAVSSPQGGSGSFGIPGDYEFRLNNDSWQSLSDFNTLYYKTLVPDTFVVWMRNAFDPYCETIIDTVTIHMPDAMEAQVAATDVTCYDAADGTITITNPINGSGNYGFSINGSSAIPFTVPKLVINGLGPGDYIVDMIDLNSPACVERLDTLTIVQPEQLAADVYKFDISCYGASDGRITFASARGGSGAGYNFSIDDGATWQATTGIHDLPAGVYEVYIQDAGVPSCTEYLGQKIINEPPPLMAQVDFEPISCHGETDGVIILSNPQNYQGGSYEYRITGGTWQNGTPATRFENLGPGDYEVEMQDANGCYQVLDTITLIDPDPLIADVSSTNTTCLGNDGTITISNPLNSVSGTYDYRISGHNWVNVADPAIPYTFNNLMPDTFVVEMRDAALTSCELIIDTVIITAPAPMTAQTYKTDVTCYGGSNGTITVTDETGGSGVYEYKLENGPWQSDAVFTGLSKGSYAIYIRDAVSPVCEDPVGTVQVDEPEPLSAEATPTNVSCYGYNDGAIDVINATGGSGSYEYSLDGTDWISTTHFSDLYAGTYNVIMRDSADHDCTLTLDAVIVDEPLEITAVTEPLDVTCYGGSDGSILVTAPINGVAPYEYSIDAGTTWQTDSVFTDLSAGPYQIMVRDALGCTATLNDVQVNEPDPLSADVIRTNETQEGANDGTITIINHQGGSGDYTFSFDGITWQADSVFNYLAPGTYRVYMNDANAPYCLIPLDVIILEAGSISADNKTVDVSCYNGSDGKITFINQDGANAYEYSIDGGASWHSSPQFNNLTAGLYYPVIRDAENTDNQTSLGILQVTAPGKLGATLNKTNESFPGAGDGTITVSSPYGGSGDYLYSLDGVSWQSSPQFNGITSGDYDVYIRDANVDNCYIVLSITIQAATSLTADVTQTNILCYGANDGTITFSNASGGSETFEYSINNQSTWHPNPLFENLAPGSYEVWVRDAANIGSKQYLGTIAIAQPGSRTEAKYYVVTPINCTHSTGYVHIYGLGGTPPYKGDLGTFPVQGGVPRTFKIEDSNGCKSQIIVNLKEPTPVVAAYTIDPPLCYGEPGTVTVTATGGTGNYRNTVGTFEVMGGSNFTFVVKDSNGCAADTIKGTMPEAPPELIAKVSLEGTLCYGESTASAKVHIEGGTPPYDIQWDDPANQTDSIATKLSAGTYTATVTDAYGCITSDFITIVEPTKLVVSITGSTNVQCEDDQTGTATVEASGGTPGYTYLWNDSLAQTTPTATGLGKGTYTVTVTDQNNCTETETVTINAYDDTPPQAVCNSIEIGLDATGHYTLTSVDIETIANGSSDNCTSFADLDLGFYPLTFDCSTVGKTVTGTLVVTDLTGNSDTCTASIVVTDTIPPQLTCQDIDLYLNSYGQGHLNMEDVLLAISDPCVIDTVFISPTDYTCEDVGVNPGTITAIDVNGNQTICNYNVTVIDTIPPQVSCQTVNLTLDETGNVTVTAEMLLAGEPSDECGIESVVPEQVSYDCTDIGSNIVKITVTDVNGNVATCDANVTINAFNLPPVAQDDQGLTVQNNDVTVSVLDNDSDSNGNIDVNSLTIANPPAHGTVVINSDLTITYTPDSMYIGADQFIYSVCDDGVPCGVLCDTALVDITVLPPNSAPTTSPDFFTGGCISIFGSLTANDIDIDGDNLVINTTPVVAPSKGTVTIYADGTFRYDFDPGISYQDSFVYEVCDDNYYSLCSQETVHLNIYADSDCDGVPNSVDIDDDNDGIIDIVEGDGTIDTDGDGIPNSLDIDADGDGIIDNIEGQASNNYIPPSGIDDNNNGLDDIYEQGNQLGIFAIDTDGDGIPDYLDPDSDNDGVPDYIEGYDIGAKGIAELDPTYSDIDGDGLDDAYDNFFGGFNENNLDNPYGTEPQLQDFDDDGIPDWRDTDDDNDMIPTKYEDLNNDGLYWDDDIDGDGHPEYLDFQGECDLFIPEGFSPNGDGIHDYFQIFCIDKYPNAKLLIFDRWGDKMYEQDHYGNLDYWGSYEKAWWDGTHTNDGNGEKLPIGNYLYILIKGDGNMERGFVMLSY